MISRWKLKLKFRKFSLILWLRWRRFVVVVVWFVDDDGDDDDDDDDVDGCWFSEFWSHCWACCCGGLSKMAFNFAMLGRRITVALPINFSCAGLASSVCESSASCCCLNESSNVGFESLLLDFVLEFESSCFCWSFSILSFVRLWLSFDDDPWFSDHLRKSFSRLKILCFFSLFFFVWHNQCVCVWHNRQQLFLIFFLLLKTFLINCVCVWWLKI